MPGASTSLSAQPELHHFSNIAASPEGIISLRLGGSVSSMFNLTGTISNQFMQMFDLYPVEASTNLTDWTRLALLLRTNNDPNRLLFQDRNFAGLDHAFCRTFTNHLITMLPKPSGPFAVGTLDRVMIDPARTNLYRYDPGTNTFMVTFWYPAEPPAAGVLPAPMWDRRFAGGTTQPRARCKPGPQNSMITASSGRPATGAPASRTDSAGHSAGPRSLVEARGEATSAGHHRRGIDTPGSRRAYEIHAANGSPIPPRAVRGGLAANLAIEPGPRVGPVTLGCRFGNAERLRRFGQTQPDEVTQLDQLGFRFVLSGQPIQGFLHRKQLLLRGAADDFALGQVDPFCPPSCRSAALRRA